MTKKPKRYKSSWRSASAEQKFREADQARWRGATTTLPEAMDVATRFGPTRVHHWPGPGADIVFLHGMGDTSFRWVPFAEALAEYNVYAIDTMGDPGGSVHEVGFESAEDYGTWLGETIAGLGLTDIDGAGPHIVAHSMGGYLALSYAVRGGAARSLVLFEPVGVIKLKVVRFLAWNAMAMFGALSPNPIRGWVARRLRHPTVADKAETRVLMQSQMNHPPKPPPLPIFTDEQVASIDMPVRLVAGAECSSFDVAAMVRRIEDLVADGRGRLLPGAGHALVMSHFDECLAEVRAAVES